MNKSPLLAFVFAVAILVPAGALAQYAGPPVGGMMSKGEQPAGVQPADLKKVDFEQRLNAQVPLDLPFRDEDGRSVKLGDYFNHNKPVVMTLVYYECPMLCTLVLNGEAGAMKGMSLEPGRDYELVTVSFNPKETAALAAKKKTTYIRAYGHPEAAASWHFLTGDQAAITELTKSVGFHYVYDEATGQYAHAAGMMILTPDGRVAKYLYGIEFAPRDMRLALVDASHGRIGNPVDHLLLYCYHYDPKSGKYGLVVMNVIRLGGVATMVLLGGFVAVMATRERRRSKKAADAQRAGGADKPVSPKP